MMDVVIFPSGEKYFYLRKYISAYIDKHKIHNPIYVYYNFYKAEECNFEFKENRDTEHKLKNALEFIKKMCGENQNKQIKIYLFTPNISAYYEAIDINDYIMDNVVEFNYIIKKCELLWREDFCEEWLNNKKVKKIIN